MTNIFPAGYTTSEHAWPRYRIKAATIALCALGIAGAAIVTAATAGDDDRAILAALTCRLSADHFRLRKWLFRDWLLTVVT